MGVRPKWIREKQQELTRLERELAELELLTEPESLTEKAERSLRLDFARSFVIEKRKDFEDSLFRYEKELGQRKLDAEKEAALHTLKGNISVLNADAQRWRKNLEKTIQTVQRLEGLGVSVPIAGLARIELPSLFAPAPGGKFQRTSMTMPEGMPDTTERPSEPWLKMPNWIQPSTEPEVEHQQAKDDGWVGHFRS